MNWFLEWLGPIMALCIGVMTLAVFFNVLGVIKSFISPVKRIRVRGVLNDVDRVTLHLKRNELLEDVRLIGLLDHTSVKGGLPYPLTDMLIVETRAGERVLLRAGAVVRIRQLKSGSNGLPRDAAATPDPGR